MKNRWILVLLSLMLLSMLLGCRNSSTANKDESVDSLLVHVDLNNMLMIADTVLKETKVSLWAVDSLKNRHEELYIQVTDLDGHALEDAQLSYELIMDMGMRTHSNPFNKPVAIGPGIFKGDAVFIMANIPDMGKGWMLNMVLNQKDSISFPLSVRTASVARTIALDTKADGRVFVSLLLPDRVEVGQQPIDFRMHKVDHHDFPTLDDYLIEVAPFMPDRGHGSKPNKSAVSLGDGRYQGMVNLSMKGFWEIKVHLFKNGKLASPKELVFPIQVN